MNGKRAKLLLPLCVAAVCLAAFPCGAPANADGIDIGGVVVGASSDTTATAGAASDTTSVPAAVAEPEGAGKSGGPRTHWGIARVQGVFTYTLGENHVEAWNECEGWFDYLNFKSAIDVNTTGGVLASFEYVVKRRYGFELGFNYWYEIVDLRFEAEDLVVEGSPNFILPTLGMNYHFLVNETIDLYGGGFFSLGVIATGLATDIEVSKDFALGVNLGMDYYVKEHWNLGATVKYIDFGELAFSLLPEGISGILCDNGFFGLGHMNVISVTCGLGYRF